MLSWSTLFQCLWTVLLSGYPICGSGILVQPRAPRQEEEEIKRLQAIHLQLSSNRLKKCENRFHFRVHLTCHICISATGRRRIVSRMMSSFQGWRAEGDDWCTERLRSRIRSNGWIGVLSTSVVFQVCELLSSLARLECKNTVAELWSVSRLKTKLCGLECAWRWIKGQLVNLRSTALPGEIIVMTLLSDRCLE
jgi:hypothetical protein